MPEGEIDSLSLLFYLEDSAGLLHASRLFELLASSYEQAFMARLKPFPSFDGLSPTS